MHGISRKAGAGPWHRRCPLLCTGAAGRRRHSFRTEASMDTMKAVVFRAINDLRIEEVPKPRARAGEAVIRILATTICGTDVDIVRGEYTVREGLILGHEPVGVIEELRSEERRV